MIYVGSPYSHDSVHIRENRYMENLKYAVYLFNKGESVFSPIGYSHPMVDCGARIDWKYWKPFDLEMLDNCNVLHALLIPGWDKSVGLSAELEHAEITNKEIVWVSKICKGSNNQYVEYLHHDFLPHKIFQAWDMEDVGQVA